MSKADEELKLEFDRSAKALTIHFARQIDKNDQLRAANAKLREALDHIAIHTLHLLWILDSDTFSELKEYFDSMPRGLKQHIGEIQKHCAEAGSKIAQTGKIDQALKKGER